MSDIRARFIGRLQRGLFPAVPATFRADGTLDLAAHERYVAWMAEQPVAGVAAWAHTGRGLLITPEQRGDILRQWVAGRNGRTIVAGVGARPDADSDQQYRADSLAMAEQALSLGADILMMHPPTRYRGRDDQDAQILDHARALAALDAPLLLFYLYEAAGGIRYSLDVLRELLAMPQVIGVKMATLDSPTTFQDVAVMIKDEFAELVLVTGEDRFLGYSLMCGASSALVGMACACIAPQARLLKCWFDGHMTEFCQLNQFVDLFGQATFHAPMEGYIQRMLWCLADAGVVPEESAHDPFGPPPDPAERALIRRRARALMAAG
ncbi:MAG: dihydrodipicolinate synthase family protein [Armatimonadetes bacterium]|nr:dihydrodipicolinate synthase family protein [Armatimonadota bacterium]